MIKYDRTDIDALDKLAKKHDYSLPAKTVEPIKMSPYEYQVTGCGSFAAFTETYPPSAPNAHLSELYREGKVMKAATIDPMEAFAETPRMLPFFSTRNGLRMSYVDSSGKQRCLNLNTADLTRIINSAAMALEIVTREQTMVEKIDAIADQLTLKAER